MMSEQDFDTRLEAIRLEAARKRENVVAYEDQAMSQLFEDCGWTQEQIAARMGKGQSWVGYRLAFAAFLRWLTTSGGKPKFAAEKLTERRFRASWVKSGKRGEPADRRFARCVPLLEEALVQAEQLPQGYRNLQEKPGYRKAIVELMSDSKRRNVGQMAEALDAKFPGITSDTISNALKELQKRPPKGYTIDGLHVGKTHQYRFTKRKVLDASPLNPQEAGELVAGLVPVCQEMLAELKKPEASQSTGLLMENLTVIQRALARLKAFAGVA
jgi:hypothetical protein